MDEPDTTTAQLSRRTRRKLEFVRRREGTSSVDATVRELLYAYERDAGVTVEEVSLGGD